MSVQGGEVYDTKQSVYTTGRFNSCPQSEVFMHESSSLKSFLDTQYKLNIGNLIKSSASSTPSNNHTEEANNTSITLPARIKNNLTTDSAYEHYIATLRDASKSHHEITHEQKRIGNVTGEMTYEDCDPKLSYNLSNSHRESHFE